MSKTINAALSQSLALFADEPREPDTFATVRAGRALIKVRAKNAAAIAKRIKTAHLTYPRGRMDRVKESRNFPSFVPGMSTREYVIKFVRMNAGKNGNDSAHPLPYDFDTLNAQACTLYEGGALDFAPIEETNDTDHATAAAESVAQVLASAGAAAAIEQAQAPAVATDCTQAPELATTCTAAGATESGGLAKFGSLRTGDSFRTHPGGRVYVKTAGGYRPGTGGPLGSLGRSVWVEPYDPAYTINANAKPRETSPREVSRDLEPTKPTQAQQAIFAGADIALAIRARIEETCATAPERAERMRTGAQCLRKQAQAVQDRAGHRYMAETLNHAADFLIDAAELLAATLTPSGRPGASSIPCETSGAPDCRAIPRETSPPIFYDDDTMKHPDNLTGAELQTMRESCGLTREDMASLARVQARTVKHWEGGRAGVPADVSALVRRLDESVTLAVKQARATVADAGTLQGAPPADLVLVRYASADDLARYRPDMAGMAAGVHGAIVARLRDSLQWLTGFEAVPVRIVWMQPELYEPWRAACRLPDTEATRSQWAAQQVAAQALPHRPDQPPSTI